ncbi:chaplin family protein [Spirillospora sp. CA-128828]|uniref:chaplin family protein n=1 Tax=Spirillospora sp. CA-128828 TaxID=3240033 RepID=UPI003D905A0B
MFKKLAATGILGFAVAGSALAATPAYAATYGGDGGHHGKGHHGKGGDDWFSNNKTSDNFGILNGTQVIAPISVPVDVCGNAVAVIGGAKAKCKGGSSVKFGR